MIVARDAFFIGNEWVKPASSRRFNLVNASTEEPLGTVPEGVEADIDAAVAAARRALIGGVKASGLGREFGPDAIGAYQNSKSIYVMG